jgi:hypothetical protein
MHIIAIILCLMSTALLGAAEGDLRSLGDRLATALRERKADDFAALIKTVADERLRASATRRREQVFAHFDFTTNSFVVVDAVEQGQAGYIIVNSDLKNGQPATDFDPLYAIRLDGVWKLLPEWDDPLDEGNELPLTYRADIDVLKAGWKER